MVVPGFESWPGTYSLGSVISERRLDQPLFRVELFSTVFWMKPPMSCQFLKKPVPASPGLEHATTLRARLGVWKVFITIMLQLPIHVRCC